MSTLGQNPSQQGAKVQSRHNEPLETADLLLSERLLGLVTCARNSTRRLSNAGHVKIDNK